MTGWVGGINIINVSTSHIYAVIMYRGSSPWMKSYTKCVEFENQSKAWESINVYTHLLSLPVNTHLSVSIYTQCIDSI